MDQPINTLSKFKAKCHCIYQQLLRQRIMHSVKTVYLSALCYSHYEQRLVPCTALNSSSFSWSQAAFYKLEAQSLEVNQFNFTFKTVWEVNLYLF